MHKRLEYCIVVVISCCSGLHIPLWIEFCFLSLGLQGSRSFASADPVSYPQEIFRIFMNIVLPAVSQSPSSSDACHVSFLHRSSRNPSITRPTHLTRCSLIQLRWRLLCTGFSTGSDPSVPGVCCVLRSRRPAIVVIGYKKRNKIVTICIDGNLLIRSQVLAGSLDRLNPVRSRFSEGDMLKEKGTEFLD